MVKKKLNIPDAINQSPVESFVQIPRELLRDHKLSFKAKGILCLLLSNKDGWCSYTSAIQKMATDGEGSVRSGLRELEKNGYLSRTPFRDIKTKIRRGSFWAYTNQPYTFSTEVTDKTLMENGMERVDENHRKPEVENPHVEIPRVENCGLSNNNSNDTNCNDTNENTSSAQKSERSPEAKKPSAKKKAKKKATKKKTDPRVKELVDYFHDQKLAKDRVKLNCGMAAKKIKELLDAGREVSELKDLYSQYLLVGEAYYADHTIGKFQGWIVQSENKRTNNPDYLLGVHRVDQRDVPF